MAATAASTFVRVGALSCQRNSFLRELSTVVVSSEEVKGTKKAPQTTYDLMCADSVLFPEGGGQPCDHGTLTFAASSGEESMAPITAVVRRGDRCILNSPVPIPVGATVLQKVDWKRRMDHMQHHTGQHLLTAVVEREDTLHLPTASWSLTHPFCFIQLDAASVHSDASSPYAKYFTKEKKITDEMVDKIQDACNDAIKRGVLVQCDTFASREVYQAEQDKRREEEERAGGAAAFRSRGIPEDVTGPIRIISLEDIDSCTCCGTHLHHLSELQAMVLLHQEVKGSTVKLFFITGERALKHLREMHHRERSLTVELGGCQPEDFVPTVQKRSKAFTEMEKKMKRWTLELADGEAQELIQQLSSSPDGARRVLTLRRDDVELEFFNAVRTKLNEAGYTEVVLVAAWAIDVAAAACSHKVVPTKDVNGQVFVTGPAEVVGPIADIVKSVMVEVKGGVSKMGFRGKGSLKQWADLVTALPPTWDAQQ